MHNSLLLNVSSETTAHQKQNKQKILEGTQSAKKIAVPIAFNFTLVEWSSHLFVFFFFLFECCTFSHICVRHSSKGIFCMSLCHFVSLSLSHRLAKGSDSDEFAIDRNEIPGCRFAMQWINRIKTK